MHWNEVRNDAKSFKQHKYGILGSLKHEASKEDCKGGMQYMAKMHELCIDRAQVGQNKDLNMLRWGLKDLGMQAYKLSHKQGNNAKHSKTLNKWMKWEHGNAKSSEMSC